MAENLIITATTCDGYSQILILPEDTEFNKSFFYQLPSGECVSIDDDNERTTQFPNTMLVYGPFNTCDECGEPLIANDGGNNGLVCEDNCSGGTFTINPPHPVYSNGQNKPIVQLNAVLLGGNGLNA